MKIISWKEPPPPTRRAQSTEEMREIAVELRRRRGSWAYVGIGKAQSWQSAVRRGKLVAFRPAGAFEARCVRTEDGDFDLYIRFVAIPSSKTSEPSSPGREREPRVLAGVRA